MNRQATHYDVLGVRRTATSGEIRSAYVRLMKQHHPDRTGNAGEVATGEAAPLINRCYAVLKDPAKRAVYDAQLRRETARDVGTRSIRYIHPRRRRVDRRKSLAVPVFLCAVGVIVIASQLTPAALPFQWQRGALMASAPLAARTVASPVPTVDTRARQEARLARTISLEDAVHSSTQCFAAARGRPSPMAAEPCIVFDNAALYWHQTAGDSTSLPLYFRDAIMWRRHTDALARFGAGAQYRLGALREVAFAALLEEVRLASSRSVSLAPKEARALPKANLPSGVPALLPDAYEIVPIQDN